MENDKRIAVLIDADNVSEKYVRFIFDEISNHGTPTYKRIYGDWTRPQFASWKSVLLNYSITPIQQYSYTTGKNATDAALIIDAMDILYSENVEGFCIVSSDSDFTRLAARLRESGMYVLGMGEKKTPTPILAACEAFKYLAVLASPPAVRNETGEDAHDEPPKAGMASKEKLIEAVRIIVEENSDEDGWVYMGAVGKVLSKRFPDFDTRNYGFSKLTPLISSLKQFEIQSRRTSNPNVVFKYIRNKDSHGGKDNRDTAKDNRDASKDNRDAAAPRENSVRENDAPREAGRESVIAERESIRAQTEFTHDTGIPADLSAEAQAADTAAAKPRSRRRGGRAVREKKERAQKKAAEAVKAASVEPES
jgi:Fe-S-cluster formation regulator IscX/YfhJ